MADFIGERLDDSEALPGRFYRLPTARFGDGKPLGAGFAMQLQQNASHLVEQNLRHLAWDVIGGGLNQTDGWSGLVDGATPPSTSGLAAISWGPTVARRYGPFCGIEDRRGDDGLPVLRKVKFEVYAKAGTGSSLTVYFALVMGIDPVPPYAGAAASATVLPSTSPGFKDATLSVPQPSSSATPMRARPASEGDRGAAEALVVPYWAWVGWRSTNGGDAIYGVGIYETR